MALLVLFRPLRIILQEWLYGDGENCNKGVYLEKLQALQVCRVCGFAVFASAVAHALA